jgi:hypothetical protein
VIPDLETTNIRQMKRELDDETKAPTTNQPGHAAIAAAKTYRES